MKVASGGEIRVILQVDSYLLIHSTLCSPGASAVKSQKMSSQDGLINRLLKRTIKSDEIKVNNKRGATG